MKPPCVLIVGNFLSGHGYSTGVCEELAPRIRSLGWNVLTTSRRRFRPVRLADMLFTVWHHRHEYDVAQVDVFSGSGFRWAEAVCRLLRRVGRPYVLTLHGGALPEFAKGHERRIDRLLNSAAAVTVPSEYLFDRMARYRSDLLPLPNALNVAAYHCAIRSPVQPRLVWLRAFHEIYDPGMAVKVIARLKDEFPSLHLRMVGADKGDSSRQQALSLAQSLGVEALVKIEKPIPKELVPSLLATGDIFLNTSRVDNTPVSVLEAMAAGMCVVSTEAGGIPYLLNSGRDSLLVAIGDDAAMAAAVRRLLTDQALAARLQSAALTKVRSFDWSAVLPQWQSLLLSAARNAPRAALSEPIPGSARLA